MHLNPPSEFAWIYKGKPPGGTYLAVRSQTLLNAARERWGNPAYADRWIKVFRMERAS